ncbi:RNA polymerase subunit sigma-70 [Amycolatopsis granulosa]|uniref:RNA polymerase subunit sigma-70 n=1 Tax=Amycolatopsis granulosa TaxID=185684 RepID=UPI0014204110|nr:RNA polymerase sigma-70 factor (ECF subfamily) [Amycolatopsis granulosa]
MTELAVDLERARTGDGPAFARLVEPLRPELHAHCYRMLGSVHDADDAVQEALLRAWRGLARFEGRASLRSWLYTVATRVCLDAVERRGRRALPMDLGPAADHVVTGNAPRAEVAWLGPYPAGPGPRAEQREAVELAFVAALQHLPGNQRAALLLFEVLGFSAAEIATMMNTSAASVNSALQRARRAMPARVPAPSDATMRTLAAAYAGALERGDADALVALLTEDVTWAMPPMPHWYRGTGAVMSFARQYPLATCGDWRHRLVGTNGSTGVAAYLRSAPGGTFEAWSITVLSPRDGRIAGITSFLGREHFAHFGLPDALS